jgi:tRNA(Ile2) C34 agmatinyltransferase TiaS
MYIIAQCPRCGYRWWLDAAAADRRLRCRKCFRLLKVPDLAEVPEAAAIISEAKSELYVDDAGNTYG